jgi:hypothetical protein
MADPACCNAERDQARPCAHGFVGPPPCQAPAPLLSGRALRDDDMTGLVIGEELLKASGQPRGQSIPALSAPASTAWMASSSAPRTSLVMTGFPSFHAISASAVRAGSTAQIHSNREHYPRLSRLACGDACHAVRGGTRQVGAVEADRRLFGDDERHREA